MGRYELTRRQFGVVTIGALGPALATRATALAFDGGIDVRQPGSGGSVVTGTVFEDLNQDGVRQASERGVAGVLVSNGLHVVRTNADGAYTLPVRDDMSVFVIKPSGWRPPTEGASRARADLESSAIRDSSCSAATPAVPRRHNRRRCRRIDRCTCGA